jgi:death on curing protein
VSHGTLHIGQEPRWITEEMLFAIHAQQIERYGGAHGVLDPGVVLSALSRAINKWGYEPGSDFADLAAMYLVGFAGFQGFNDGNKRTGLACALVFFAINDIPVDGLEPDSLLEVTLKVATGKIAGEGVAQYFRAQLGGA